MIRSAAPRPSRTVLQAPIVRRASLRRHWVGLAAALISPWCVPALASGSVEIAELVVATTIPVAEREAAVSAARAFYDFWNTGDEFSSSRRLQTALPTARYPRGGHKDLRDRFLPRAISVPPYPTSRCRSPR